MTSTGPIESAKSRLLTPGRSGAVHAFAAVNPPIAPSAPIIAATDGTERRSFEPSGYGISSSGP